MSNQELGYLNVSSNTFQLVGGTSAVQILGFIPGKSRILNITLSILAGVTAGATYGVSMTATSAVGAACSTTLTINSSKGNLDTSTLILSYIL